MYKIITEMYKIITETNRCGCVHMSVRDTNNTIIIRGFIVQCPDAWGGGPLSPNQYELAHWLIDIEV